MMVAEDLLAKHVRAQDAHQDLENVLQSVSEKSPTSKPWAENLIHPVLLMIMFTQAEQESD